MTRDSREFSAALVLGALGGAAVALALRSGSGRGRSRAWSDLLEGVDWRGALASLRTTAEPVVDSTVGGSVGSGIGTGLDALRKASHLLRDLKGQVAPGRR
ncbi:MAG: hypothetical protein EA350_07230 [Gemmatimonadales bacterium]|nr:MAG: hypothetical protein EA350_07230 [Gemmatimonadales bacterium]